MLYQNSSKDNEESTLLRTGLSCAISSLSIIFSLKSLLSLVKMEKSSKKESTCNIRGVPGPLLAYYGQVLPFFQRDVTWLNVRTNSDLKMALGLLI